MFNSRKNITKIRIKSVLAVLILLLYQNHVSYSQERPEQFTRIETESGLPPGNVNDIVQDSLGFIWIGTESGLARYDGYKFKIYKNKKGDSTSLSHNNIFSLLIDKKGVLWVGTLGGGLNKFNIKTGKFARYKFNPADSSSISDDRIYKVFRDSRHRMWISTLGGGLNLFNPETGKFKRYQHNENDPTSISSNLASSIFEDSENNFWIGTFDQGLNHFDPETGKFLRYKKNRQKFSLNHNQVMDIIQYSSTELLVGTFGGGVNLFDFKKRKFYNISNQKSFLFETEFKLIRKIFDDGFFIWIATHLGLYRFDKTSDEVNYYSTNPNDPSTINNNSIRELFADQSGLIWIGTNYGVNVFDRHRKKFSFLPYDKLKDNISRLDTDDIGTRINWAGKNNASVKRKIRYFGDKNLKSKIKSNNFLNHYIDEKNKLWVGNYQGLKYFDKETNEFRFLDFKLDEDNTLINDFVKTYYYDHKGVFWAGLLGGGLVKYDSKTDEYQKFLHYEEDEKSISDSRVMVILEDRSGLMWIGTYGGLDLLDRENNIFEHFKHSPEDTASISNERILSIYESEKGDIWIGTYQGLNKFDRNTNKFIQFTINSGLEGNTVYGILEDNSANLWLATNKGISLFNPETKQFKNYNLSDGLAALEVNGSFCFKDHFGKMYFGAKKGFITFYPEEIEDHKYVPPVVFTELKVMNTEVLPDKKGMLTKPINETEVIKLSYNQNIVSLEFAALHYANPLKNKYAYRIENYTENWQFVESDERIITLNNIAPGEYNVFVKGTNSDGVWNAETRNIKIIVFPPFYETWWFRITAFFIVILMIFLVYEYRLNRLMEVERTRTRIARNLHDEVGGTLASIQYFVNAIRKNSTSETREKFLDLITDSSNDAQEKIRDIIWTVNPEEDGLGKFFVKFNRYASDLFDTNEINYKISLPEKDVDKNIDMEKRQHLWCICKETVTNTVKHSKCKNVQINFWFTGSNLNYEIIDDGIGIEKDNYIAGQGLKNISNRAEILKAKYEIDSNPYKGLKFKMSFKI